ncbi:hypothetical protein AUJ66_06805 [Candidatus Desantisbacteria bacterium CG1_02_38_46]|uniref:Gas vesicle protein GvpG n=1 Tax=Candidatus Desantisbacteria bacterium CG1_02_38_46 TaxID=1817893 RepID=A0A1J4SA31_9BACT|nr:MAG: hypothetical protein AUJ66_06805 [Candidatus Desantisbacteria bacterium CG1_02_38_46]
MFILDDLLLTPIKLGVKIVEQIRDMAENELYGEDKIKGELLNLQMMLESEEITEEEYKKAEAILIEKLEESNKRKEIEEK